MTVFSLINNDPLIFQLCCFLVAKSCPTLCDHMDCSPLGSSVCGISHARILEWVAISFPRGSSQARAQIRISFIGKWIIYYKGSLKFWLPGFLGFVFAKAYLSWLLTYLFRAVAQRYLRGCLLSVSPQKIHRIKRDSQLFGCAFFPLYLFLTEG